MNASRVSTLDVWADLSLVTRSGVSPDRLSYRSSRHQRNDLLPRINLINSLYSQFGEFVLISTCSAITISHLAL